MKQPFVPYVSILESCVARDIPLKVTFTKSLYVTSDKYGNFNLTEERIKDSREPAKLVIGYLLGFVTTHSTLDWITLNIFGLYNPKTTHATEIGRIRILGKHIGKLEKLSCEP